MSASRNGRNVASFSCTAALIAASDVFLRTAAWCSASFWSLFFSLAASGCSASSFSTTAPGACSLTAMSSGSMLLSSLSSADSGCSSSSASTSASVAASLLRSSCSLGCVSLGLARGDSIVSPDRWPESKIVWGQRFEPLMRKAALHLRPTC
eukprot:scaffold11776_cov63-Phaeocystis_antarctica.AAC.3